MLAREARSNLLRRRFVAAIGEVPYRDFTFDKYRVHAGNTLAFEHARALDPTRMSVFRS
jgi:hypothetical protein